MMDTKTTTATITAPATAAEATEPRPGDLSGWTPSLLEKAISAAAWAGGASWLIPMASTMMTLHKLGIHLQPMNDVFCRGMIASTGSRWRAFVDPRVKSDQPYLFIQNHSSHLDFVGMYPAVPHEIQGIELESHFDIPVYGPYMKSRGTIGVPVAREGRTAILEGRMGEVIERGDSILAFPEGTRTISGRVGPFRRGLFFIARNLGLQVVPTTVTGLYDIMRKGSNTIRPFQQVTVWCDAPVDFAGLSDDEVEQRAQRVRRTISDRVDRYFDEGER
jgi:1-acyl-sn-glycerol-3-phosphate acyltransferase